jgi:hypothetical protein
MGAALFAAIRAFIVTGRCQPVMRPTHITPRRRFFSLWDRHGGQAPSKPSRRIRDAGNALGAPAFFDLSGKTSGGVNRKAARDSSEFLHSI